MTIKEIKYDYETEIPETLKELQKFIPDSMFSDKHLVWTTGKGPDETGYRLSFERDFECEGAIAAYITLPSTGRHIGVAYVSLSEFYSFSIEEENDELFVKLKEWNYTEVRLPIGKKA